MYLGVPSLLLLDLSFGLQGIVSLGHVKSDTEIHFDVALRIFFQVPTSFYIIEKYKFALRGNFENINKIL